MDSRARAEKIIDCAINPYNSTRVKLDFIIAQIDSACEEAVVEDRVMIRPSDSYQYQNGFTAAKQKAVEIAKAHECLVIDGECGCEEIASRISKMDVTEGRE